MKSGALQTSVSKAASINERTVRRRVQELVSLGALRQTGAGPNTTYRNTGLI